MDDETAAQRISPRLGGAPRSAAVPTILLVDDAEKVRHVTRRILQGAGFAVREAATGTEGLRLAAERPDLIILDVRLPDLDGFQVCRRLKTDPVTTAIPVLHLSGVYRGVHDRVRGLETGADGYLTKPFEAAELVATVNALLRLRRAESALRESEARRRAAEDLIAEDATARRQLEERLRQSQKMEAIGRLAGGVAHDFNNMLTVITSRSDLLLELLRPQDPLYRHVDFIQKTADRAAALTHQLLAFSRKQLLNPRVLNLNTVIEAMRPMLGRLVGEHIEIVMALDGCLGMVRADHAQLEQVILNLVINARDAMPEGGRLTLETENVEIDEAFVRRYNSVRPGPYVRLTVEDTGIGMDAATQAHLFEPFYTTKGPGKGTGLGLATVYGIVKQSGGSIRVDSAQAQGATFAIHLPRVEASPEIERPAGRAYSLRGTETILVVEDEEVVRDLAREILERYGYTVMAAEHPGEALLLADGHRARIHLLLTDVVMPKANGPNLAHRLRTLRPDIKVLYMSGYTDDQVLNDEVLARGYAFLPKPFKPDTLARKVREVLEDAGS
jgi:two-component system cell cycle sensor histidine kinase/response regulator CckA